MMKLNDRIVELSNLLAKLETTPSRIDKEYLINKYSFLGDDLTFAFEVLTGQHKIGFTWLSLDTIPLGEYSSIYDTEQSLRDFCNEHIFSIENRSVTTLGNLYSKLDKFNWFFGYLFNRQYKTGINRSQLKKSIINPMLAKKYEPDMNPIKSKSGYYITQKLDGNRCIAKFDSYENKWEFYSRSGKLMKVDFETKYLDKYVIYDGEVLSKDQVLNPSQTNFNTLSGIINSDNGDKSQLVYYVFDIIADISYRDRREYLDKHFVDSKNIFRLPLLDHYDSWDHMQNDIFQLLDNIVSKGGEGLMINVGDALYEQKRTNVLLKLKEVQTMDMKVIDVLSGTGKNEYLVGSLECMAKEDGKIYSCQVGSGLSNYERQIWSIHPERILGKIVEVQYFSISQNKNQLGTNIYSLRFPRLKRIREDKNTTSVY